MIRYDELCDEQRNWITLLVHKMEYNITLRIDHINHVANCLYIRGTHLIINRAIIKLHSIKYSIKYVLIIMPNHKNRME